MDADELKQMDLLVERGLYASRETLLQSAARNLLHERGMDLPQAEAGRLMAAGIVMHNRRAWKNFLPLGGKLNST
jgi:Arc/MetJ-type ribon-helix-helix transcriptional regulator